MSVKTLFSNVSSVGKPDLYSFVVQVSRKSESVIKTKRTSDGIVNDLCEILHTMYAVNVRALIGTDTNSWVVVESEAVESHAFMDMKKVLSNSSESRGMTAFFSRNRKFLDFFQTAAIYTPLVRCFEYVIPWSQMGLPENDALYIGPRESFIDKGIEPLENAPFPWAMMIDTSNSQPIINNVLNAICAYALAMPMEQLNANATRFFLMQKPNSVIALVNFVSNEHLWVPLGGTWTPAPATEEQFTIMFTHARQYGTCAQDVTMRLLIYYARLYMMQVMSTQVAVDSEECYMWLTAPELHERVSLTAAVLREKQAQESECYLMRTTANTILPILWTKHNQVYRGMLVTDTHPAFATAPAFRKYVTDNIMDMLKATAATADTHMLLRLLTLWESLFSFVVTDVRTYMTRCSWQARNVFLAIIDTYVGDSRVIDLPTFLTYMHSMQPSTRVLGDIVITQDLVLFLTMPSESQCVSVKAFHAVMGVDPDRTAGEMWNNAFQVFLAGTDASEREMAQGASVQITEPQETDENVGFTFPDDVHDADKATLYLLLRSRDLHHLLALSPFIPAHQSWVSVIVKEGEGDDIFSLASKAHLIGMTQDLVVFILDGRLCVTIRNGSIDSAVGIKLIMAVVNAYNILVSKVMLAVTDMKYTMQEVVMLFRAFNVGYRETESGQKVINQSLLREAMVHVLLGIYPTKTHSLGAVWSDTVDFLLSGAISHRASHTGLDNDSEWPMEVDGADTSEDSLNTMITAVRTLYPDRVQAVEVVSGSIYFLEGTVSSAFMVALCVLKKHEHLIRNVHLRDVRTDAVTIGVLASIVVRSLYGGFGTVRNMVKVCDTIVSRHQSQNPVPFIVRQILRLVWSKHEGHLHLPDVESDSHNLISTWERNIADESMPFYHAVLGVVLVDDLPKESALVGLDHTVSVIVQNGIGSKKQATVSMLVTDWPLTKTWEEYIHNQKTLSSALNTYKGNADSRPVSSLLHFDKTVSSLWIKEGDMESARCALLPNSRSFFLESIGRLVQQITTNTTASCDAVVKVLDKVVADDAVFLVSDKAVCGLHLLPNKKQNSVLTIGTYRFALLDQSIALPFDTVSQRVDLQGPIDSDLLLITGALMHGDNMSQNEKVISDSDVSDWVLACMKMIAVEKQRKAAFLCLNGMLHAVQPYLSPNSEVFEISVLDAVQHLPLGTVTTETRRTFLQNVFTPFMDAMNRQPDVGACILRVPSSSCDYNILCTETTVCVSPLYREKKSLATALKKWINNTKDFLQDTSVSSTIDDFMQDSRTGTADPVGGKATAHVFDRIPNSVCTRHLSAGLMGTVAKASVLNAWITDIPATEIYMRNHLIATGRQLINAPCIDMLTSDFDQYFPLQDAPDMTTVVGK